MSAFQVSFQAIFRPIFGPFLEQETSIFQGTTLGPHTFGGFFRETVSKYHTDRKQCKRCGNTDPSRFNLHKGGTRKNGSVIFNLRCLDCEKSRNKQKSRNKPKPKKPRKRRSEEERNRRKKESKQKAILKTKMRRRAESSFDYESMMCGACGSLNMFQPPRGGYGCADCRRRRMTEQWKVKLPECVKCLITLGFPSRRISRHTGSPVKAVRGNRKTKATIRQYHFLQTKDQHLARKKENKKEKDREYSKKPQRHIKRTLHKRIQHALKGKVRSARTMELVGCDIPTFIRHIESQFAGDMRWENHGSHWHIDHIIPCASFDLIHADQQKACFHYSNLRPLEKTLNLKKGAKMPWDVLI